MKSVGAASAALLAAALAACSGFRSQQPPTQVYLLRPATVVAAAAPAAARAALAVGLPVAAPGLNNERVALVRGNGVLDSYAASRWPEVLPEVLQPLIVDALRAGGQFGTVQADAAPFKADYLLLIEVREFAAVYAGDTTDTAPTVRVQWVATLGRRGDRTILRSFRIETSAAASANRATAVMEAFNRALGAALTQLVTGVVPDSGH